jgi:hypothetical protein
MTLRVLSGEETSMGAAREAGAGSAQAASRARQGRAVVMRELGVVCMEVVESGAEKGMGGMGEMGDII